MHIAKNILHTILDILRAYGVEWTLREGTIIAALMFGPMMDFWKTRVFASRTNQ